MVINGYNHGYTGLYIESDGYVWLYTGYMHVCGYTGNRWLCGYKD